jgi:hypothetical protein
VRLRRTPSYVFRSQPQLVPPAPIPHIVTISKSQFFGFLKLFGIFRLIGVFPPKSQFFGIFLRKRNFWVTCRSSTYFRHFYRFLKIFPQISPRSQFLSYLKIFRKIANSAKFEDFSTNIGSFQRPSPTRTGEVFSGETEFHSKGKKKEEFCPENSVLKTKICHYPLFFPHSVVSQPLFIFIGGIQLFAQPTPDFT